MEVDIARRHRIDMLISLALRATRRIPSRLHFVQILVQGAMSPFLGRCGDRRRRAARLFNRVSCQDRPNQVFSNNPGCNYNLHGWINRHHRLRHQYRHRMGCRVSKVDTDLGGTEYFPLDKKGN